MTIISYSEREDLAREVAAAAQQVAASSGDKALSVELDGLRSPAGAGGDVVLLTSEQRLSGSPELAAAALLELARRKSASAVMLGATRFGRLVSSILGVRMKAGTLSDVKDLKAESGSLSGVRGVYAGKFSARVVSPFPCIVTVQAGAYEGAALPAGAVETMSLAGLTSRVAHLETRPKPKASVDLKTASIIVSAGRGFKKKEDLALAEQLAKAMGGVVGCSRPLSSDLGWLGEEHHIGLTGIYVHPDLYVAVGISGQLQHVAGIKDSKVIVAVNRDKQAPIFQVSDYGIVGDLYQVVPAMLKLLGPG